MQDQDLGEEGVLGDGRTYLSRLLSIAVLFYSSTYMITYTYLGKVKLVAARFEFTEEACITQHCRILSQNASPFGSAMFRRQL